MAAAFERRIFVRNESNLTPSTFLGSLTVNGEASAVADPGQHRLKVDVEVVQEKALKPSESGIKPSYPDGGLRANLVVLGAFCCMFSSFGWVNCVGIFQDYYQTHQLREYSPSAIAWISSLEIFMMFAGGPICGKLYDNNGPRRQLLFGSFMHVLGLMMTSISTKYYQFLLAQGICSAIGASAIFHPSLNVIPTWFLKNRALAFGVTAAGSSLGGVLFPLLVEYLLPRVGFGWTMRVIAFVVMLLLIVANLTVRSRLRPSPKPVVIMEFINPLREASFLLVCIGSYLFLWGQFLPMNFLVAQASTFGMSRRLSRYLLAILNGASLFGRIIPGYVGDRIGRFNVTVAMMYFTGIIVLALWLPARCNAAIITFAALFGIGSGAFVSMLPALVAQISDIHAVGVRTGTFFAFISSAALFGNPVGGALITHNHGGFQSLQILSGVMMLAGSTLLVLARVKLVGWRIMRKV